MVWSPDVDPRHVAGLASTRTYPLRSSFRPSYNMAVNLVGSVGVRRARDLLESSFAQFQADRCVVGIASQVHRNTGDRPTSTTLEMGCDRGDFARVLRDPDGDRRPGEGDGPAQRRRPPRRRADGAGEAQDRRRDPGAVRQARRARGRARPGRRRLRRAASARAHRGPLGRPDLDHRLHRAGRGARPGPGAEALQPALARPNAATSPPRCAARRSSRTCAGRPRPRAPPTTTANSSGCATTCASTRATRAPTGRSTPAGPSGAGGWRRTPTRCGRRSPPAPGRSPGCSTRSARCCASAAT